MDSLTVNDTQCAALFVSGLQRSDATGGDAVAQAATRAVRQFGVRGCVGLMAQEFGDHPEAATDRMQWIRQLCHDLSASPTSRASAAIAA
jgi:hypothetical protein